MEGSDLWFRGMVEVGRTYGWRISELREMKVSQVNLLNRDIRLEPGTTEPYLHHQSIDDGGDPRFHNSGSKWKSGVNDLGVPATQIQHCVVLRKREREILIDKDPPDLITVGAPAREALFVYSLQFTWRM